MFFNSKDDPFFYHNEIVKTDWHGNPKLDRKGKPVVSTTEHRKDKEYYMSLGVPEKDAKILAQIKKKALYYDGRPNASLLGGKFRVAFLINLVPVIGDATDTLISLSFIYSANKITNGLGKKARMQMLSNIGLSFLIGLVPEIGAFLDGQFRCNTRNTNLLEQKLIRRVKKAMKEKEEYAVQSQQTSIGHEKDDSLLQRPSRTQTGATRHESPVGSTRQKFLPDPPKREDSNKYFGIPKQKASRTESGRGGHAVTEPSPVLQSRNTGTSQGKRFITSRDL